MRWVVGFLATLLVLSTPGMSSPPASAIGEDTHARSIAPILPAAAVDDRFGKDTPVMVVLDTSGSMDEEVTFRAAPGTRLDVAKSALLGAVDALPATTTFGLMTYPGGATVDGCEPGESHVKLDKLNQVAATVAIRGMTADGGTPTGPALQRAAQALEAAGHARATIVLVSDGESNCGPPPCDVVKELTRDYVVTVNTVGFHSGDVNEEELTCIAQATGGVYISADDHDELIEALRTGTQALLGVSGTADDMAVVAGPGDDRNGAIQVEVRNTGVFDAKDVRLSLRIDAGADQPGTMLVPRPVRFLGNIASGDSVSVSFEPRPTSAHSYRWAATASAANAVPYEANGWLEVTDHSTSESLKNLLSEVDRVAVVGDSYSSGHGAGTYIEEPHPDCARSMSAYGQVLFGRQDLEFIACSGAVTGDFRGRQVKGDDEEIEPQLATLRAAATSSRPPQAVLLTIGGNDAKFGDVAASCVNPLGQCGLIKMPDGSVLSGVKLLQLAYTRGALVAGVLQDVDAAVNDEVALARRTGQVAPIVILSYPRIVPRSDGAVDQCLIGVDAGDYTLLNLFVDALNAGIVDVATQLRASGRPVYVVRESAESFQPNHTICEGAESWAVTKAGDMSIWNPDAYHLIGGSIDPNREYGELLHPNSSGHRALARAVVRWSHTAPATATAKPAVWEDARIEKPAIAVQRLFRQIDAPGLPKEPGGSLRIRSSGHLPHSSVSVWMESRPVSLGSLWADDSGDLDAWVQIPKSVEANDHSVKWLGPDAGGQLVLHTEELSLAPRGSRAWALLGLLGGLLTLGGAVLLGLSARSRAGGAS